MVVMATVQVSVYTYSSRFEKQKPLAQLLFSCPYLLAPFKEIIFNKCMIYPSVFQHHLYSACALVEFDTFWL